MVRVRYKKTIPRHNERLDCRRNKNRKINGALEKISQILSDVSFCVLNSLHRHGFDPISF